MKIKVSAVQMESKKKDKSYNTDRIRTYLKTAKNEGSEMVIFPEMCITGYWHVSKMTEDDMDAISEPVPGGPSFDTVRMMADDYGITVGFGLLEKEKDRWYNTYVVAEPGGSWHRHRKIHAFENKFISSGDSFTVFQLKLGFKAGILICYDNNIVENVRINALMGADLIIAPHQTGGCNSKSPYAMGLIDPRLWFNRSVDPDALYREFQGDKGRNWIMRWLPSRAHDNGVFYIFSNGVGYDDGEVRTGNAMILDPYGRIISESRAIEDDMISADLDFELLVNCTGRRWIRGRKPGMYQKITEVTGNEFDPFRARFSDEKI